MDISKKNSKLIDEFTKQIDNEEIKENAFSENNCQYHILNVLPNIQNILSETEISWHCVKANKGKIPNLDEVETGLCIASCIVSGKDNTTMCSVSYRSKDKKKVSQTYFCNGKVEEIDDMEEIITYAPTLYIEPINSTLNENFVVKSCNFSYVAHVYNDNKIQIPPINSQIEAIFWKCSCLECCSEAEIMINCKEDGDINYESEDEYDLIADDPDDNNVDYDYYATILQREGYEKVTECKIHENEEIKTNKVKKQVIAKNQKNNNGILTLLAWNYIDKSIIDDNGNNRLKANENNSKINLIRKANALKKILISQNNVRDSSLFVPQFIIPEKNRELYKKRLFKYFFEKLGIASITELKLNKRNLSCENLFPVWSGNGNLLKFSSETLNISPQTLLMIDETENEVSGIIETYITKDSQKLNYEEQNIGKIIENNIMKISSLLTDQKLYFRNNYTEWSILGPKIAFLQNDKSELKSFFSRVVSIIPIWITEQDFSLSLIAKYFKEDEEKYIKYLQENSNKKVNISVEQLEAITQYMKDHNENKSDLHGLTGIMKDINLLHVLASIKINEEKEINIENDLIEEFKSLYEN